jgi:deoxyribose-phosphate aldolase
MINFMDLNREDLGRLFEAGNGVTTYHTPENIELGAEEAKKYGYRAYIVSSNFLPFLKRLLVGTEILVGATFSYPWGDMNIESKKIEIKKIIELGAETIDGVINMSFLKSGYLNELEIELNELVSFAKKQRNDIEIKFIVECMYLTDEELVTVSKMIKNCGADYIKTTSGWPPLGATPRQIKLIRQTVGLDFGIKGCGLTSSVEGCMAFFDAGADIIGETFAPRIIENFDTYLKLRKKIAFT